MLVLSRRLNEKIVFPQFQTAVQVVSIKAGLVRLGIDAPAEVTVLREEVPDRSRAAVPPAVAQPLYQLVNNRLRVMSAGLAELRREIEAGASQEAEDTLAKLEEDFRMLQDRLSRELQRPAPAPQRAESRKALLVEDNANERELLATYLRAQGMEVATASDGTDALDYLHHRERPDVVLLDMGLPRCDGATMVRELRRDPAYAGLKIFAVTGHLPEEYGLACGPGGVDRWFHKPINPDELVRDLNQELSNTSYRG